MLQLYQGKTPHPHIRRNLCSYVAMLQVYTYIYTFVGKNIYILVQPTYIYTMPIWGWGVFTRKSVTFGTTPPKPCYDATFMLQIVVTTLGTFVTLGTDACPKI